MPYADEDYEDLVTPNVLLALFGAAFFWFVVLVASAYSPSVQGVLLIAAVVIFTISGVIGGGPLGLVLLVAVWLGSAAILTYVGKRKSNRRLLATGGVIAISFAAAVVALFVV